MNIEKFIEEYTDKTTLMGIPIDILGLIFMGLVVLVGFYYIFTLRNREDFANAAVVPILIMFSLLGIPLFGTFFTDQNAKDFVRDYVHKLEGAQADITEISQFDGHNRTNDGFVLVAEINGKSTLIKTYDMDVKLKKDLAIGSQPYMNYVDISVDSKKYTDYKWLSGTYVQEIHVSKDFKMDDVVESEINIK